MIDNQNSKPNKYVEFIDYWNSNIGFNSTSPSKSFVIGAVERIYDAYTSNDLIVPKNFPSLKQVESLTKTVDYLVLVRFIDSLYVHPLEDDTSHLDARIEAIFK